MERSSWCWWQTSDTASDELSQDAGGSQQSGKGEIQRPQKERIGWDTWLNCFFSYCSCFSIFSFLIFLNLFFSSYQQHVLPKVFWIFWFTLLICFFFRTRTPSPPRRGRSPLPPPASPPPPSEHPKSEVVVSRYKDRFFSEIFSLHFFFNSFHVISIVLHAIFWINRA